VSAPVVAVLHHLQRPFTGHAGAALRAGGVELDERDVRRGDPLPGLDEVDGIVSLGGEQSVLDLEANPRLAAEAALLREAVERELPVLGACLGAQLLAHALGGGVHRRPRRRVAWVALEALDAAREDPLLRALPGGAAGLHFNEDGIDLPPGAVELLRGSGGDAEAFRVGPCAWGVQFHAEVDEAALEGWYRDWPEALEEAGVTEAQARVGDARHLSGQRALSDALFGGFARVVTGLRAGGPARSASRGGR
jgi:GMP synthase-like glutamine amidotransferase